MIKILGKKTSEIPILTMQIFEVFPSMEIKEIVDGVVVSDIINESNNDKVFLLVDHDTKRIWIYNFPMSSIKKQINGGILAGMLRQQLKLFYRVYPLNVYSQNDPEFQELMNKKLGPGRAKPIEREKRTVLAPLAKSSIESMVDYIKLREEQVNILANSLELTEERHKGLEERFDLQTEELNKLKLTSPDKQVINKVVKKLDLLYDEISSAHETINELRKNLELAIEEVEGLKKILREMLRGQGEPDSGYATPFPPIPPGSPGAAGSAKQIVETVVLVEEAEYELICKYCGSKLAKENKFCKLCGKKVE